MVSIRWSLYVGIADSRLKISADTPICSALIPLTGTLRIWRWRWVIRSLLITHAYTCVNVQLAMNRSSSGSMNGRDAFLTKSTDLGRIMRLSCCWPSDSCARSRPITDWWTLDPTSDRPHDNKTPAKSRCLTISSHITPCFMIISLQIQLNRLYPICKSLATDNMITWHQEMDNTSLSTVLWIILLMNC